MNVFYSILLAINPVIIPHVNNSRHVDITQMGETTAIIYVILLWASNLFALGILIWLIYRMITDDHD